MIEEVLISLRRIIRAMDLHSKHLVKTTGLTTAQLLLMQTVRDKKEMTIGELASDIHLSQATVTTILDRLEARKLLIREGSKEDKRKVHIRLTDEGRDIISNAPVPLQAHFIEQFSRLEPWEQSLMLSSLQRIAQMMDAGDIDASPILEIGSVVEE